MKEDTGSNTLVALPDKGKFEQEKNPLAPFDQVNKNIATKKNETTILPPCVGFGIMCCIVSGLLFSCNSMVVKLITSIEAIQISASRCYVQSLILIPMLFYQWLRSGVDILGPPGMLKLLIFRGFFGSLSAILIHQAIYRLAVGDAMTLEFTNVMFSMLFGCLCLGESLSWIDLLTSVFCISGVVMIAQPPFLLGSNEPYDKEKLIGIVFSISSAILHALTFILVRKLGRAPPLLNIFYYSIIGSITTTILTAASGSFRFPCPSDLKYLFLPGIIGVAGQYVMTLALKYERAGTYAVLATLQLVAIFLLQVIVLKDMPTIFSIIGAGLIFLGAVAISVRQYIQERKKGRNEEDEKEK